MRHNILSAIALATMFIPGLCFGQGAPQVTIKDIVEDSEITGDATSLPAQAQKACVVVYVHTDVWYVHPYTDGGPGQSYAMIDPNGNWRIKTVKRDFPANQVAAIVLKDQQDCSSVPGRTNEVYKIKNVIAIQIYDLKTDKTQWHGHI